MKEFVSENKWFTFPYLIILLFLSYFLIFFTKSEIHLYINHYHNPFFDQFFKYITNMGDGIFIPVYLLILVLVKFRHAVLLIIVFLVSGLVVQILKRFIFDEVVRPTEFFKGISDLYLVPGVKQHCCRSFPSGHTATAFSSMICFVIASRANLLKILFLIIACLIAFSRVYLSQHFIIDIFAGSIIGTLVTVYSSYFLNKAKSTWLDKNIINVLQRRNP